MTSITTFETDMIDLIFKITSNVTVAAIELLKSFLGVILTVEIVVVVRIY